MEHRTVKVPVYRNTGGNTDNYEIELKNEHIRITEADGIAGFGVHFDRNSFLEVRRDDTGQVMGFNLRVGDTTYSDLDGDGRIDGYIGPNYTGHILVEASFVPVRVGKGGLRPLAVVPEDGSPHYHYRFQDGQWQRIEEGLHHFEYGENGWRKREP